MSKSSICLCVGRPAVHVCVLDVMVLGVMCRADRYVGMPVMDAKQLTDMELLVLV